MCIFIVLNVEACPFPARLVLQRLTAVLRILADIRRQAKMEKLLEANELDEELAGIVKELWEREDIKDIFDRRNELNVQVEAAAP